MKLQNFNSREELWGPVLDGVRVQLVSITRVGEDLNHRIMMEWFRNCILFNYVPTCGFFIVRLFHLEKLFMVNLIIGLLSTFSPRHSFTLFGQPRRANILCPNQISIHPSFSILPPSGPCSVSCLVYSMGLPKEWFMSPTTRRCIFQVMDTVVVRCGKS